MANFLPLKNAILYCLERLIVQYDLKPQFLDVGCGVGDVSVFLAKKGWGGTAIDVSPEALERARGNLNKYPSVQLKNLDFSAVSGTYNSVLVMDVLEHVPDDAAFLAKLATVIADGGSGVITVPSNPRFWGWDDDFYGHVRRYTPKGIEKKIREAGLRIEALWDFTFPVLALIRQVYTRMKRKPDGGCLCACEQERTQKSGVTPSWKKSFWVDLIGKFDLLWKCVYAIQYRCFRHMPRRGHEMMILVKKMENTKSYGS